MSPQGPGQGIEEGTGGLMAKSLKDGGTQRRKEDS